MGLFHSFYDHKRVAIAGWNKIEIWDVTSGQQVGIVPIRVYNLHDIAWSKDDSYIVSADWTQGGIIWDVRQYKRLHSLGDSEAARSVDWSNNNKYIIIGGGFIRSGYIKIYDARNYRLLKKIEAYNLLRDLALSPDDQYMASGHEWGVVKLWGMR